MCRQGHLVILHSNTEVEKIKEYSIQYIIDLYCQLFNFLLTATLSGFEVFPHPTVCGFETQMLSSVMSRSNLVLYSYVILIAFNNLYILDGKSSKVSRTLRAVRGKMSTHCAGESYRLLTLCPLG